MKPRHLKLLRHLCLDVRLVDATQAVRLMSTAGADPSDTARELADLVSKNFLSRMPALARRPPATSEPQVKWGPGAELPDFAALAWRLDRRWDVPPEVLRVYRAGPAARHVFGSGSCAGGLNFAALSHDLACADLLLTFAEHYPERLRHWVGEDVRKQGLARGEKLPDVILYDERPDADPAPYLVCEIAGTYPKARLEAFHAYVADRLGLPYEIW